MKTLSTKSIFMISFFIFSASCLLIYCTTDIYLILLVSSNFGLILTVLNTLPYKMIFDFNESIEDQLRGVGVECSVLSCAFFLAQMIVAALMSSLIYAFGNSVIFLAGAAFSALGFVLSWDFLIYPQNKL